MLTEAQAKKFIEKYGNDDVFYSYHYNKEINAVEISYFSHLGKFLSPQAIDMFVEKYEQNEYKYKHLLRTLVISETSAYIEGASKKTKKFIDTTLIDSYYANLEDVLSL